MLFLLIIFINDHTEFDKEMDPLVTLLEIREKSMHITDGNNPLVVGIFRQ